MWASVEKYRPMKNNSQQKKTKNYLDKSLFFNDSNLFNKYFYINRQNSSHMQWVEKFKLQMLLLNIGKTFTPNFSLFN